MGVLSTVSSGAIPLGLGHTVRMAVCLDYIKVFPEYLNCDSNTTYIFFPGDVAYVFHTPIVTRVVSTVLACCT